MEKDLPAIPAKRYFTIGEVSELCGVKPHVLRYWEQEFTQLRPIKRRGNRRYYQHHEVLMIRRISDLLYGQGFTISGARNRLHGLDVEDQLSSHDATWTETTTDTPADVAVQDHLKSKNAYAVPDAGAVALPVPIGGQEILKELKEIRELLSLNQ